MNQYIFKFILVGACISTSSVFMAEHILLYGGIYILKNHFTENKRCKDTPWS